MNIVEINTEEFNHLGFARHELPTREDNEIIVKSVEAWAIRNGADIDDDLYKYPRHGEFLWMIRAK